MRIAECQVLLRAALGATRVAPLPGTVLAETGSAGLGMARAYLCDGTTFAEKDDPVNALASFYYAFGWLHCGAVHGTLVTEMPQPPCPFLGPLERLLPHHREKLAEKAGRYERLLNTARASVACAPDPATPSCRFATRILGVAEVSAGQGRWFLQARRLEDALATFSYGHGWIDAGAREGLFVITAERDIFTI